ncbi:MAG TPA: AIR synthase related protein, partial [Candidatus Omnitrophota bacterium]|nr:AIR synthase related protein [Candidatus Omnitrophota bacterium]
MTARTLSEIGEFGLIARLAKGIHLQKNIIKGIGDDAAVLPFTKEKHLLFTTDLLCAGVHFSAKENGRLVGRKALACSLSDIAAMGGVATSAVVSIGLPKTCRLRYVEDIYRGMNGLAKEF